MFSKVYHSFFCHLIWIQLFIACEQEVAAPVKVTKYVPPPPRPAVLTSCATKKINRGDGVIHVLFVGNSLTYYNNLPLMVVDAAAKDGKQFVVETLAFPNYALEDHWLIGRMQQMVCQGNFDYVVVQQGPSSQEDGRAMLLEYGTLLKTLCDSRGSKLAFFMVWPARQNYHTFPGVISNYSEAALATNSILCPVGSTWKRYIDRSNDYSYYSSDSFHPSVLGSQVAADIIYSSLINN